MIIKDSDDIDKILEQIEFPIKMQWVEFGEGSKMSCKWIYIDEGTRTKNQARYREYSDKWFNQPFSGANRKLCIKEI
jgi:hypothetical protein